MQDENGLNRIINHYYNLCKQYYYYCFENVYRVKTQYGINNVPWDTLKHFRYDVMNAYNLQAAHVRTSAE